MRCEVKFVEKPEESLLEFSGLADVAAAREVQGLIAPVLVPGRRIHARLSGLERLDTAGLQLLLAASAWAGRNGGAWRFSTTSDSAAAKAFEVSGAGALLTLALEDRPEHPVPQNGVAP